MIRTAWLLACVLVACGGDAPKQAPAPVRGPAPTSPAPAPAPAPVAPVASSPLAAAISVGSAPLETPASVTKALETADALMAFAHDQPRHADAAAARLLAASLRLVAVAASEGLATEATQKALGGQGAPERQLRLALEALQGASGDQADRVRLAVSATLGADPEVKDVSFDHDGAWALAQGATAEGAALRAAWLARMERGLLALREQGTELRFTAASRAAGKVLCASCGDAHHMTPDMVSRYLVKSGKAGGIVCAAALAGEGAGLAACLGELGLPPETDPVYAWGANFVALGLYQRARALALPGAEGAGGPSVPLAAALAKRAEAVARLVAEPLFLPVVAVTEPFPKVPAEGPASDHPTQLEGLGQGGLTLDARPETLVVIGPSGSVLGGAIPRLALEGGVGGKLVPGTALGPLIGIQELIAAEPEADGSVKPLVAAIVAHFPPPATAATAAGPRQATLVVDARARAAIIERVIDSMRAAGFQGFVFEKTATHGRTLPLLVGVAPEAVVATLKPGYERPLVAVVGGGAVDIWEPAKASDPAPAGDVNAKPPAAAEQGFRGTTLARLRVPIPPEAQGLDAEGLKTVGEALAFFQQSTGAGPLCHVIAGEGARALDVLAVARIFQERKGTPIAEPQTIWAGSRCGGEDYRAAQQAPAECPTGVAVAWSDLPEPSSRGITSKPGEKKEKEAEAKPPAPAGPGFCNKGDIAAGMAKRAGQFRFCYEKELQQQTGLQGRVVLKFTIGLDGKLTGPPAIAAATLQNELLHRCLLKTAEKLSFNPPDGGVCVVNWPFTFSPK